MSSPTPSPDPQDSSWKRKFEVLQAQLTISQDFGPKIQGYTSPLSQLLTNIDPFYPSATARHLSLGRGLRRTVAMFNSVRDLVEENDHRLELIAEDSDYNKSSAEYVLTLCQLMYS